MVQGTDAPVGALSEQNEADGPLFKLRDDPGAPVCVGRVRPGQPRMGHTGGVAVEGDVTKVARRPWWRRPGLAVLVFLVAWGAWAGLELMQAARDGRQGVRLARGAANAAADGAITDRGPLTDLRRGQARFEAAQGSLHALPMRGLGLLPVLGRQVRELQRLSDGAVEVTDISADTLQAAQAAMATDRTTALERVAVIRALGAAADNGARRAAAIHRTSGRNLVDPVRKQHDMFWKEVDRAQVTLGRAAAGLTATADVLGGPRRYLVLAANNAEMRAGSGMYLSVGALETRDGKLGLIPFTPSSDLTLAPPGVPISGDLADRWGWLSPGQEWRNLGVSPRFDQTAQLAAAMWQANGRGPVDGVLAVDPVFLEAVLDAVGTVEVDGERLDSSNVTRRILHDQYVAHAGDSDQGARQEELGLVARAILGALETRSWDPARLAKSVAEVAQGRHILAWSSRPVEQRGWMAAGIDGAMAEDSLMLGVLNRGANKLDQFLSVDASLDITPTDGKVDGVLTVRLRNDVPVGEPTYVAGPNAKSPAGEGVYLGILTVNLPGAAAQERIDDIRYLAVAGADGPTRVIGAEVRLARGEERTYVVRFELPAGPGSLQVEATGRVPSVRWAAQHSTTRWAERPQRVTW